MNQIISLDELEREELALFERKAKENLARRVVKERAEAAAKESKNRAVEALMQREAEGREESQFAALFGVFVGAALVLGCVALQTKWFLLVALGWYLGFLYKAVHKG